MPRKRSSWPYLVIGAGFVLASTVMFSACGSERSAEAYCTSFYETAAPIRQGYLDAGETADEDPLGTFVKLASVPGDMVVILDSMVDHAPDEIRPDTEAARDAIKGEADSAGDAFSDPLGALASGLSSALTSSGSFQRIDAYLNEHCPVDSQLAQDIINGS